jgi:branched-chain amino acid transport system ATP-binding protein
MTAAILSIRGLAKRFGANVVSGNIDLDLVTNEVHAVIGPNGAGKTTLINQVIGELTPDAGTIYFDGRDITALPVYQRSLLGLSRSYQITSVFPGFTALENVSIAAQGHDGHSFGVWHPAAREETLTAASLASLQQVGLAEKAYCLASELAHGERRQLELAMALVSKSKVLLLDEPSQGLAPLVVRELARVVRDLCESGVTILLIEQNIKLAEEVADRLAIMVKGKIVYSASPAAFRADEESVRSRYLAF